MSETDSFIEEVTEEVRRDRLYKLFRKYGWIGVTLVVLVVGGTAWTEWSKAQARHDAQVFGDAVLAALDSDDAAARAVALEQIGAGDKAGRTAVLGFLAADEALKSGDRAAALTRLQALAADANLADSYRQLAELKAVILADADMPAADRDAALSRLAAAGAPYRVLALEQQALVLAKDGKIDEALGLFNQILNEPDVTAGLRRRASQMIVVLGGEPGAA
ncbi:tetratricopeptide repeat protein [Defluviimonas aestuarii]|uniref:tetratricopeptide repeat protein n=1 Tax=Albidovulum aestuarii TaxID=1130726 RepID=UPI00249C0533|nr:tetratricopeptide repeat protein [Defluviimonas aestuarii]MDI3337395.1 tetratricopeptide repeat protein [Defluviimonas aestuarii]